MSASRFSELRAEGGGERRPEVGERGAGSRTRSCTDTGSISSGSSTKATFDLDVEAVGEGRMLI